MPWFTAIRALVCLPEGGEGTGGGGGSGDGGAGGGEKMLAQSEVQRIVAKEVRAASEKAAREAAEKARAEIEQRDTQLAELKLQLETAGKSAEEKARIESEQKREAERKAQQAREAQITKDLQAAQEAAKSAAERLRDYQIGGAASSALVGAKVLSGAIDDALRSFRADSQIEIDDDGKVASVIYKGVAYDSLKDAAKAFLKDRPHFAQPSAIAGAGVRTGGGNGAGQHVELHKLDRTTLLKMSAAEKRGQRSG